MPIHFRPVASAARAVLPPPRKGSNTVPPSGTMLMSSAMSGIGLLVRWTFSALFTGYLKTPGRHCRVWRYNRPLQPYTMNSASRRNSPSIGRDEGLFQTTIPRHANPAACTASVTLGSWRQSVKTRRGAPSRAIRQHSQSHCVIHHVKERWSLASPGMGGYVFFVPVPWYF